MSHKKEHSVMGLPRESGKRRWSGVDGDDEEDDGQSPPKVLCTSPPYGLCAEDVIPNPPPSHRRRPRSVMTETMDECEMTHLPSDGDDALIVSDSEDTLQQYDDGEEDENFIDDEEDKDSGFIDGNSIDNSSDDDCDTKGDSSFTSTSSNSQHPTVVSSSSSKEEPVQETDFQMSLAKVLSSSSSELTVTTSTCVTTSSSPNSTTSQEFSSLSRTTETKGESGLATIASTQTITVVTSSYQGSLPSTSYDLHTFQATDNPDMYQSRPCSPSWGSCNFYDGSQPTTTNKYMEISPSRGHTAQSIQCDENGKSYLELGSASPYNSTTYSTECGSFTPPPNYNGNSYSSTFTGSPTYPPSNGYFNNRPGYSPNSPYGYNGSESYSTYEGEGGCSYGYVNGGYSPHNSGRGPGVPGGVQTQQRCASPACDPTKTSPRPGCYPQQRLSVLNLSMFKLNRFSRFPEPSLHRSVLICNTLRHIEKEMEAEGLNMAAILAHSHAYGNHVHGPGGAPPPNGAHSPDTLPSMTSANASGEGPLPSIHSPLLGSPLHPPLHPVTPPPSTPLYSNEPSSAYTPLSPYPHEPRDSPMPFEPLRDNIPVRPFATLLPSGDRHNMLTPSETLSQDEDTDSVSSHRLCEDRSEGGINWCSVLSLSSQTDLDSMNNNECNEWNNEGESSTTLTTLTTRGSALPSSSSIPTPIHYTSDGDETMSESSTPNWKLPSLSADDVLKSFPEPPRRQEEDIDSIMKVLVGS